MTPTAWKGSNGRVEQASKAVEGCGSTDGSPSGAMGDPARSLAVGAF